MFYTVKSGDSLWPLVKNFLGTTSRWTNILAANNIFGTNINVGRVFIIPDATTVGAATAIQDLAKLISAERYHVKKLVSDYVE